MKYYYDTEFVDTGSEVHLISIGIVAEDGREYYGVNLSMPVCEVRNNEWVMANVMPQLPPPNTWKPKYQIRDEVHAFLTHDNSPELWAWFAAYDHLMLSQLWGRMIDVPAPIPQYTNDVRALVNWTGTILLPSQTEGAHDAPKNLCPAIGLEGTEWEVLTGDQQDWHGRNWWKLAAIRDDFNAEKPDLAIWIDDDIKLEREAIYWAAETEGVMAISPDPLDGLTRDCLTRITKEIDGKDG